MTVWVKEGHERDFIEATAKNHEGARGEPGNLRFDVLQKADESTRFFLYEVYRTEEDFVSHQATSHYLAWKSAVADWMTQPRQGVRHHSLLPVSLPHGTACAALLAPVMEANVQALREQGGAAVLSRYERIGEVLTAKRYSTVDDAIDAGLAFVRELVAALGIPGLGQYGLDESDVGRVVEAARGASSMKYNPVVLTQEVLRGCLRRAL